MICFDFFSNHAHRASEIDAEEKYDTSAYAKAIRRAYRRAKIETWSPSRLRHHAACTASELADRDTASALLGHLHSDTTSNYLIQAIHKAATHVAAHG